MQTIASVMVCITSKQNNINLSNWNRETIKEGTPIATVMPSEYDIAVETFVNPL
jgi:hypothetical protein